MTTNCPHSTIFVLTVEYFDFKRCPLLKYESKSLLKMEIHLERGSNRCWFEQTSIWLAVEAPIRTRVDRTSIWKGKKEDILSRRQIQEKIFYRKFKFWPRVILPNFELENSKFDLSLFTSLQRQTPKGICTRQMYKINKNFFPDSTFNFLIR